MTIRGPFAITLVAVLVVSVAINLLIAGFVMARVAGPPRSGSEIERIVALGARAFPRPIREEIAARSRERRDELGGKLRAVQDARRQTFEAMRAEPFDPAALEAANTALRAATEALQLAGQDIVIEVLRDVPPEVRRDIRLRRGPRGPDGPPR